MRCVSCGKEISKEEESINGSTSNMINDFTNMFAMVVGEFNICKSCDSAHSKMQDLLNKGLQVENDKYFDIN